MRCEAMKRAKRLAMRGARERERERVSESERKQSNVEPKRAIAIPSSIDAFPFFILSRLALGTQLSF